MTFRCEVRIIEDEYGDRIRVLAPTTAEDLPLTAQECAEQHLLAELQGRWGREGPMPYRVEVRVWRDRDQADGQPDASAAWDTGHGIRHSASA
ncbi:hypothetical protein [Streptacidiphilus jiangxiensis]|uniref:Uncharacterized protein n=1 Tax=Streptacidiphilus jiangxiensis TaxID=235985 RepID=A0A1H8ALI2_STRJI|nr:hypothetical protein [Streptacidiphilus jiangxiensis]SEM71615.1 hypothetical protein SAMN05414137_14710 [Streptacidiphilus jiangxiensis]